MSTQHCGVCTHHFIASGGTKGVMVTPLSTIEGRPLDGRQHPVGILNQDLLGAQLL
jgi:hypothetical protein